MLNLTLVYKINQVMNLTQYITLCRKQKKEKWKKRRFLSRRALSSSTR